MKAIRFVLFSLLLAAPLFAGGLSSKYKEWAASPQAYFMTADEKVQWSSLTSDADAEKFIADFLAKRGPQFVADVDKAVSMADKYMTVGKTPGSKTVRGKVVIMLGPPSGISTEKKKIEGDRRMTATSFADPSFGNGGPSVASMADAANSAGAFSGTVNEYTISYAAGRVAGQSGDLKITVVVENDGTDHPRDKKAAAELDQLLESVAKSRAATRTAVK